MHAQRAHSSISLLFFDFFSKKHNDLLGNQQGGVYVFWFLFCFYLTRHSRHFLRCKGFLLYFVLSFFFVSIFAAVDSTAQHFFLLSFFFLNPRYSRSMYQGTLS